MTKLVEADRISQNKSPTAGDIEDKFLQLTGKKYEDFQAEHVAAIDRAEETLNSPFAKAVEKRLGEVFALPEEQRQAMLDTIVAEERTKLGISE